MCKLYVCRTTQTPIHIWVGIVVIIVEFLKEMEEDEENINKNKTNKTNKPILNCMGVWVNR